MNLIKLRAEYEQLKPILEDFKSRATQEIKKYLDIHQLKLEVPIDGRVKDWESAERKIISKEYEFESIRELDDLVGIRCILLFPQDVERAASFFKHNFRVLKAENTADRLQMSEFGYNSYHLIIELPSEWPAVSTAASIGNVKFELQVRSLAQHIWGVASHLLHYKKDDVPTQMSRRIHRVSALLETVDLELQKALDEKKAFVLAKERKQGQGPELDLELLKLILDTKLPPQNKLADEPYGTILSYLQHKDVTTKGELEKLLDDYLPALLKDQEVYVLNSLNYRSHRTIEEMIRRGIMYSHAAFVNNALVKQHNKDGKTGPVFPDFTPW